MPSFELGFSASVFTAICMVLAAGLIAGFAYRRTLPPVSSRLRLLLILLRATSLALLLLLLVEPVLRLTHVLREESAVAVLIDNSASMHLRDAAVDRPEALRRILRELTGAVPADVLFYTFGTRVSRPATTAPDSLSLNEETTDIAQALRQAARDAESRNIRAAVLLTDGVYTAGNNPLYVSDEVRMPVYTVGIGDSMEQRDLLISSLSANDLAYEGSPTPANIHLKSSGYGGERVTVQLQDGSREMTRETLTLQPGTREYALTMYLTPQGAGVHRYAATVSTLAGEVTAENNRRGFSMRVLKSKLTIVLLAGMPGPDVAAVRQSLSEDPNLRVIAFVQKQDGGFLGAAPTALQMDSADCLALIDFPTSATRENVLSLATRTMGERHTPLLFIAGREIDVPRLTSLALPCTAGPVDKSEQEVFFAPSEAQKNHPLLLLDSIGGSGGWRLLPPVFRSSTTFHAAPDAAVLGTTRTVGVALPDPIMLAGSRDSRKALAVLCYGVWRWRLMAQGRPETEHLLTSFLSTAVRWLTTREDTRRVRVHPVRPAFSRLEPVAFEGEVYDAAARPLTNASVRVMLHSQGAPVVLDLAPAGNGRYTGEIAAPPEGEYVYHAAVEVQGVRVGADSGRFVVGGLDVEGLDTRMASGALRELAARSGGAFFPADDVAGLITALKQQPQLQPVEHRTADTFELRRVMGVLLLVMGLLALEWFIRKRSGML